MGGLQSEYPSKARVLSIIARTLPPEQADPGAAKNFLKHIALSKHMQQPSEEKGVMAYIFKLSVPEVGRNNLSRLLEKLWSRVEF